MRLDQYQQTFMGDSAIAVRATLDSFIYPQLVRVPMASKIKYKLFGYFLPKQNSIETKFFPGRLNLKDPFGQQLDGSVM